MGAFKLTLPFGERTVIESSVSNLLEAGIDDVVVVLSHRAEEVRSALSHLHSVRFAVNPEAESEMGASIGYGVRALRETAEAILIALADHPAVPSDVIARLHDARSETGARIVVPVWQGRGGHPVLIDAIFRERLVNLDPSRGLRALFDEHLDEVFRLEVDAPYVARDMDTWDDYLSLHREVFGRPPREADAKR